MFRVLAIVVGLLALAGVASAESERISFSHIQAGLTEQLNAAITADLERAAGADALQIPLPESREDVLASAEVRKGR
jgi:hypothetical protein